MKTDNLRKCSLISITRASLENYVINARQFVAQITIPPSSVSRFVRSNKETSGKVWCVWFSTFLSVLYLVCYYKS